ncbi:MAG: MBOAT family O-acyltransferase [Candidatus Cryptobacteroides sp.]|nr:MBOAT family protein [Bacteroidales bacterium]
MLGFFTNGTFSLASGEFLVLFPVFLAGYCLLSGKRRIRNLYLLLFSLFLYWKLSGIYVLLLIAVALTDWLLGKAVRRPDGTPGKWPVALSVFVNVTVLAIFKASGFFSGLLEMLAGKAFPGIESLIIPAGVSFFIFQSISYVVDIYRGTVNPVKRFTDYLLLLSFFPKMTLGPLVRNKDFIPQIENESVSVTREDIGEAARLIASGIIKYSVIARCVGMLIAGPAFSGEAGTAGSIALLGLYAFAIQIYCDFSGYTDLASGVSLLMGFRLPVNFNAPYKSATITEFWRRWHISLSSWLRDYLYIPLGGSRKGDVRTYINLIITMFLGGLWHGCGVSFIIWGLLHGVALSVHKVWLALIPGSHKTGEGMNPVLRFGGVLLTFHIVLAGWLFFNAPTADRAGEMLVAIFSDFNLQACLQFISGTLPAFALMLAGYILHFLPSSLNRQADRLCSGGGIVFCAILILAAIWIALQVGGLLLPASGAGLPIYANF